MRVAQVSIAIAIIALSSEAAAQVVRVTYIVEEKLGSWQPLDPGDVAKTIEHAALEVLSKPGLMQLARGNRQKLDRAATDYVLSILGRTVDEAETHTVYLTFEPGAKSDIASFRASNTVELAKVPRGQMLAGVEASARRAATELLTVLQPQLVRAARGSADPDKPPPKDTLDDTRTLPWKWPDVHVPAPSAGRAAAGLYSKNHDERQAALRELTSLALTEASPRNVLERCVLDHKDKELRLGCLRALRPLARKIAPTQRVVIEAFRKDGESDVRSEASEQMTYFVGPARAEAVQAWLESAARCSAMGPLDQLGDLPNLDIAIRSCLLECGKKPKYQRSKRSCIEMLKPVPLERRRGLLWRHLEQTDPDSPYYIEGAGEREGSTGTDWQWAVEAVMEGARRWDPALEEILWKRYQRTLSSSSLDILCDYAPANERSVDRMLELVQTAGTRRALQSLERMSKEKPELKPKIREKLAELSATGSFPKTIRARDIDELVKDLGKEPKEKNR